MAYVDEYNLMADATNDLHKKFARAIDKAARDVLSEAGSTANHAARAVWAKTIRRHPDRVIDEAHRWMPRLLDNSTVAAAGNEAADNDVQFVVDGLVDTFARGG